MNRTDSSQTLHTPGKPRAEMLPTGRPSTRQSEQAQNPVASVTNAAVGPAAKALRRPWYAFWKLLESRWYAGRTYTLSIPNGYRVYTPWFSTDERFEFTRMVRAARQRGPLTKSADRCYMLYQFSRSALRFAADWAECGVHTGGTAHLLSLVAERRPRRVHLFDTFSGMPTTAIQQRDYHAPGEFADTSLEQVQQRLSAFPFVTFHPGELPGTFDDVARVDAYSFVHVDVDIYAAVLASCKWFWPRLCSGGIIVFNDYGMYPYRYAGKAAIDDYFAEVDDGSLIILPTGQAVAIKH
jgi:O-methyltransferase